MDYKIKGKNQINYNLKNRKEVKKMTKDELQNVCDKKCKQARQEKIVSIIYTIVKVVAGALIGHAMT